MIELFGNIVGLVFFAFIIIILVKTKDTHPQNFTLEEGEQIIEMTKGDYWVDEFILSKRRSCGKFAFTNKRIIFRENFFGDVISVPYSDIVDIQETFIFYFDVKTKYGKSYRFAMMKRKHYIDLIKSFAKNN